MTAPRWTPAMARLGRWMGGLCLLTLLVEAQGPRERRPVVRVPVEVVGSLMGEVTLRCQLIPASSDITRVTWSKRTDGDLTLVAVYERGQPPYYPLEHQHGRLAFRSSVPTEDAALIIQSLMVRDGGTYHCTFIILQETAEAPTTLIITAKPNNSAHAVPASVGTTQLAEVAVCTSARGYPPAKITWVSDLSFLVNTTESVNTDGTVTVQSRLLMKPAIQAHNQTATCMIRSRPGAVEESIPVVLSISCDRGQAVPEYS
ncbi:nectin-2-like isoform X2 [Pleurodeles waltl]|uniref:nectin-2-like isoform X2 n=1 Tax=Pleurodeles waltl TaxID=8319 RepID=UPI003709BBE7